MKYTENGYKQIERGVFVRTYVPFEDGTLATDKQKTAIKNMLAHIETGYKEKHCALGKKELKRVDNLTKVEAMQEIGDLIREVKNHDDEMNSWDGPF